MSDDTLKGMPTIRVEKRRYGAKRIYSPAKMKVLLLLQAGVALAFAGTLGGQFRILEELSDEWKSVERKYLRRIVKEFYEHRLVSMQENDDGTATAVLTEKGRKRAITLNMSSMKIAAPRLWNGLWHVVIFDIPEKYRAARIALRDKLLALGFFQCQKSVYVHPYPCRDEVEFIASFFAVGKYVRYGILSHLTNEEELLLFFNLKRPA